MSATTLEKREIVKKSGYIYICIACVLLVLFATLSVLLTCVDVQEAGKSQAPVGFSTLNQAVFDAIGEHEIALTVSVLSGLTIIGIIGAFGVLGIVQAVRRKGILRADKELYVMAGGLVLLAVAYVFFELVIINYRPVLEDGALAASYPSSHSMLAVAVAGMGTAYLLGRIKSVAWRVVSALVLSAAAIVTVAGRLLGGVHWLTDIAGGCLYGLFVVFAYLAVCAFVQRKDRESA